jgi:hypothetical protein
MPKNHLAILNAQSPNSVSFRRAAFKYIFIFEVPGSSTTWVQFYHTARCHNQEDDSSLYGHRHDNLDPFPRQTLNPRSTIFLEKLIVAHLVKDFIDFIHDASLSCSKVSGAYPDPRDSTSQSETCFD